MPAKEGASPIWGETKTRSAKESDRGVPVMASWTHPAWTPWSAGRIHCNTPRGPHAFIPVPPTPRTSTESGCRGCGSCVPEFSNARRKQQPAGSAAPTAGATPPASRRNTAARRSNRRTLKWPPNQLDDPSHRNEFHVMDTGCQPKQVRHRPLSATSATRAQVVYHTVQYQDLLIRSREVVSAHNGFSTPKPETALSPQVARQQVLRRAKWRYGDDWSTMSKGEQSRALDQELVLAGLPSHVRNQSYSSGGRSLRRGEGSTPPLSPCHSMMDTATGCEAAVPQKMGIPTPVPMPETTVIQMGQVGGVRAGQAQAHKEKRTNIQERMMATMSDADKATITRQLTVETKSASTRQRSRMKLNGHRQHIERQL
jgi:hypothetical protein